MFKFFVRFKLLVLIVYVITACAPSQVQRPTATSTASPIATKTATRPPTITTTPTLSVEELKKLTGVTVEVHGKLVEHELEWTLEGYHAVQVFLCEIGNECPETPVPVTLSIGDEVVDGCRSDFLGDKNYIWINLPECKKFALRVDIMGVAAHETVHALAQRAYGCTFKRLRKLHIDLEEGLAERVSAEVLYNIGLRPDVLPGFPMPPDPTFNKLVLMDDSTGWTRDQMQEAGWHFLDYLWKERGGLPNILQVFRLACGSDTVSKSNAFYQVYGETSDEMYKDFAEYKGIIK